MSFTSNVPSVSFLSTGVSIPTESDILAGVQADIDTAFGGGVNSGLSTPQGQLAQSFAAIIGDKNDQIANIVNQINPDTADGAFQDAIGRIYFLDRVSARGTVVTASCYGAVGTVIPAGSLAKDSSGYLYASESAATIGNAGVVLVSFQNQTTGAIPCAIGSLSTIFSSVIGWESITNAAAGALGSDVESRADFEFRRRNSVAINAVNSVQSIQAAILGINGVNDCYVKDNYSSSPLIFGATSYSIAAHSVCVSVSGGTASDIATAIWDKKSPGCGMSGNTTYTVEDRTNYDQNFPTYTITWLTPTNTSLYFNVQIANSADIPSDIVSQTKTAIYNAFTGADGGNRARIASTVYAGRFYAGVTAIDDSVQVLSIQLGKSSGDITHNSVSFGIDEMPTLDLSNITVTLV